MMMKENCLPDNHDSRLKYYEILLERKNVENIPQFPLPEGYHFVYYQDGDKENWIEVEKSAKEFVTEEEGEQAWERYFGGHERELYDRMFFIETNQGEKVATATAFYDPMDTSGAGWLHWVAVKRTHQRRGLARPLISRTLGRLAELGYSSMKLHTQTTTWVAAGIYMDFGFTPIPDNAVASKEGYRILRTLTDHPTLKEFEPLPFEEIWK